MPAWRIGMYTKNALLYDESEISVFQSSKVCAHISVYIEDLEECLERESVRGRKMAKHCGVLKANRFVSAISCGNVALECAEVSDKARISTRYGHVLLVWLFVPVH